MRQVSGNSVTYKTHWHPNLVSIFLNMNTNGRISGVFCCAHCVGPTWAKAAAMYLAMLSVGERGQGTSTVMLREPWGWYLCSLKESLVLGHTSCLGC